MENSRDPDSPTCRETIEIMTPAAALVIRSARCPNGCLLMASDVPIGGHPSIHVRATHEGEEGDLFMDPAWGSFEHRSAMEIKAGGIVFLACPHCGVSLVETGAFCTTCSAPVFAMQLPMAGRVEGCTRKGCFAHRLEIVDLGTQLPRLYGETQTDAYL